MQHDSRQYHRAATAGAIYPAFCFTASPTYHKWVKLTAADVHALRTYPGFEGQNIYFHLNHPIRFVYVAGPILDISSILDKYTLLTLDDGSGSTIEIKISHVPPTKDQSAYNQHTQEHDDAPEKQTSPDADEAFFDPRSLKSALATKRFETQTAGLTVIHEPEPAEPITLLLDTIHAFTIGSPFKAKGTLSVYRNQFQITLLRAAPLLTTAAEIAVWEDYKHFCDTILCNPWTLSLGQIKELELKEEARRRSLEMAVQREYAEDTKRREKRKRYEAKRQTYKEKEETKSLSQRKFLDGNPLDRPLLAPVASKLVKAPIPKHMPKPPVLKSAAGIQSSPVSPPPALAHPRVRELASRLHVQRPPRLLTKHVALE